MKRSVELIIAIRNLPLFGHRSMVRVLLCLGFGMIAPTAELIGDGIWTKAIDRDELELLSAHDFIDGLITGGDHLYRPELNRFKRSGEHRRFAVQPT